MRLQASQSHKKIIFIGGSNLAYGIHSDLVHSAFPDYEVFNMGVHAGMGLKTMLDQIEPYVSSKDVVIIIPEYEQFIKMFYGNSSGIYLEALIDQPRYLKTLATKSMPAIIEALPAAVHTRLKHMVKVVLGRDVDPTIYSGEAFNEHGDMIRHKNFTETKVDFAIYENLSYKDTEFKDKQDAVKRILTFQELIESRNASLYIAYPAFMNSIYNRSKPELEQLDREISLAGIRTLYRPGDSILADTLFLDTSYHLLYKSAETRTKDLIGFMRGVIDE